MLLGRGINSTATCSRSFRSSKRPLFTLRHPTYNSRLYLDCLRCLEEFEQGEIAATTHHWQWAYRWPMPIHVIAGLLSGLARQPDHADTDRAWEQVEVVFQRYNNEDMSMAKIPAWHAIETLCDQAMAQHPGEPHEGRAYTKRIHKHVGPSVLDDADRMRSVDPMMVAEGGLFGDDLTNSALGQMFATTDSGPLGFGQGMSFYDMNADSDFPSLDL